MNNYIPNKIKVADDHFQKNNRNHYFTYKYVKRD